MSVLVNNTACYLYKIKTKTDGVAAFLAPMQLHFICFLKYVIDRKFVLNYAGNVLMKTHFHFRNLGNTTLSIIETDLTLKYEI